MRLETERKITHLLFGTVIALMVLTLRETLSLIVLGTCIAFGVVLSELMHHKKKHIPLISWFIRRMERERVKPGRGTIHFFLGCFIALAFFSSGIVFVAALILAFGDSFSAIVGKGIGRVRIYGSKTLEGTLAGFVASFLVSLPYLPIHTAALACAAAALIELFAFIDDNVVIPPVAAAVIAFA